MASEEREGRMANMIGHDRLSRRQFLNRLHVLCATLVYLLASGVPSYSQQPTVKEEPRDEHHHHTQREQAGAVNISIPDVKLIDQDGREVRFYSDLIKGRVVAINFIFTTCTTICPPLAATFSKIQSLMSDRIGKDLYLISISVDPVTDTPERLKAWGEKFGRKKGWTFVTGGKQEVDTLLRALNAYSVRKEDHTPMVIIGNDAKGVWTRAYGLAPASKLADIINAAIGGLAVGSKTGEVKPR
jgi:protein SCO1/2